MSIIRYITWDEFPKILGQDSLNRFIDLHFKQVCVVLFLTDWSFPSRLALKRIKKLNFDKSRCAIVDVDLVDSMEIVDHYEVAVGLYRSRRYPTASCLEIDNLCNTSVGLGSKPLMRYLRF